MNRLSSSSRRPSYSRLEPRLTLNAYLPVEVTTSNSGFDLTITADPASTVTRVDIISNFATQVTVREFELVGGSLEVA